MAVTCKTSTPRLGRVRLKGGGSVTVLRPPPEDPDDLSRELLRYAHIIVRRFNADDTGIAGFAIVAWDQSGVYRSGLRIMPDGPIRPVMACNFVHDALLSDIIEGRNDR